MSYYETPVKHNSLSWRVINGSHDADPTKKVFLMGGSLESKRQAVVLRDAFKDLSSKWAREIEMTFSKTKTHFQIAGGNYTFFFVLPALFKAFRKKHPFLRLKLELLELRDGDDLTKKSPDFALAARHITDLGESKDYTVGAEKHGYVVVRKNYPDWNRFAVAEEVYRKHGSKEKVFKLHDFISTSFYVTFDQDETHLPQKVFVKDDARYSVGLYAIGYEMMLNGLGVFRGVCKHNAKRKGVVVLEEQVYEVERFLLVRNPNMIGTLPYKIVNGYLNTTVQSAWNGSFEV